MLTPIAFDTFEVLIDEFGTAETSLDIKSKWINISIRDFVEDRINPKQDQKGYHFMSDNRLRAEFKELYIAPTALALGSTRLFNYPADFKYPGTLKLTSIVHGSRNCDLHAPTKIADLDQDSFVDKGFEPHAEMTSLGFYFTSAEDDGSDISGATLSYLSQWTEVSQTEPATAGSIPVVSGDTVYVTSGNITYNGTWGVGDTFVYTTGTLTGSGSGSVITSAELNDSAMYEIIRKAAYMYLVSVDQLQQAQAMMGQELNS